MFRDVFFGLCPWWSSCRVFPGWFWSSRAKLFVARKATPRRGRGCSHFQRMASVGVLALTLVANESYAQTARSGKPPALEGGPQKIGTHLNGFGIPFSIRDPDNKFIEVQLYVSRNRGLSWEFYARQNLDAQEIPFETQRDGEFWFALKTLDRNRQLQPPGPAKPELIVVVDRVLPKVDFRVQSDAAGRVVCRWKADDQNIDSNSVRLEYRPLVSANDAENTWIEVPYKAVSAAENGTFSDQYAFWADCPAPEMVVRLTIADWGGNQAQLERQIVSPRMSRTSPAAGSTAQNGVPAQPASYPTQRPVFPAAAEIPSPSKSESRQSPSRDSRACPDGNCEANPLPGTRNPGWIFKRAATPQMQPPASLPGSRFASPAKEQTTDSTRLSPADSPVTEPSTSPSSPHQPNDLYGRSRSTQPVPNPENLAYQQSTGSVTWESRPATSDGRHNQESQAWPIQNSPRPLMTLGTGSTQSVPAVRPQDSAPVVPPQKQPVAEEIELGKSPPGSQRIEETSANTHSPKPMLPADTPRDLSKEPIAPKLLTPPAERSLIQGAGPSVAANGLQTQPHVPPFRQASAEGTRTESDEREIHSTGTNDASVLVAPVPAALPLASTPAAANAIEVQSVNSKRFRLNYENNYLDPSLIKTVTLWMTPDGGQNWTAYGEDADKTSPFPVQLDQEGTFGFRVVFETTEGASGRNPGRGDLPDMWIRVDVTAPTGQLLAAPYGRGADAGALVIQWRAEDDDLGERPIKLSWSRLADGPWTSIVTGHPNGGSYVWRTSAEIPEQVYLQLEVTDAAGNVTTTATTRPIDLTGLVPRGRILSADPVK